MRYEDVIQRQNDYKTKVTGDIFQGMYIKEKLVEFRKQLFFDGIIGIYLPNDFIDIPLELAKLKYPSENRPQIMKMSLTGEVNVLMNLLPVDLRGKNILDMRDTFKTILHNTQPSNIFYEKDMIEIVTGDNGSKIPLGWFDYISYVLDGQMYNMVGCMSVGDQLLHIVINSKASECDIWKEIALQIFSSISIEKREGRKCW